MIISEELIRMEAAPGQSRKLTKNSMRMVPFRQNDECVYAVLSDRAYCSIVAETMEKQNGATAAERELETGGILLGNFFNGVWYITEAVDPGMETVNRRAYFEYDSNYVNHLCSKLSRIYQYPLTILGVWHRHPGSLDTFSMTDIESIADLTNNARVGILSMLVNIDPQLRMTFYYCNKRGEIMRIPCDVGDVYIPEELLSHADPNVICERVMPGITVKEEQHLTPQDFRVFNSRYFESARRSAAAESAPAPAVKPIPAAAIPAAVTASEERRIEPEKPADGAAAGRKIPNAQPEAEESAETANAGAPVIERKWEVREDPGRPGFIFDSERSAWTRFTSFSERAWCSMVTAAVRYKKGGLLLGHFVGNTALVVESVGYDFKDMPLSRLDEDYTLRTLGDKYRKPLHVIGCWYAADDCGHITGDDIDRINALVPDDSRVLLVKVSTDAGRDGVKIAAFCGDGGNCLIRTHEAVGKKNMPEASEKLNCTCKHRTVRIEAGNVRIRFKNAAGSRYYPRCENPGQGAAKKKNRKKRKK